MRGFILIYTLILLLAIAMISFVAMQMMTAKIKSFHSRNENTSALLEIKKKLRSIEQILRKKKLHCLIGPQSYHEIAHLPLTFWKKKGCHKSGHWADYYFVIEFLNHLACAKLTKLGVDYFRITVLAILKTQKTTLMFQSTLTSQSKIIEPCKERIFQVTPGLQSQREVFWTG